MGSGPSAHQNQDLMDHHHQYPDMNMIFRGIPKMIQVADDMHRMTDYIMDLRNMTIGLVIISVIGVCGFLLLRIIQGRSSRRRRQRSIMRHPEEAYLPPIRHYYQSQYAPEPWDRMKTSMSHQSQNEEKKSVETPMSTSESKPNGTVPYKYYNNEDQFSPTSEKRTTPPLDASPYKRATDIQLLVENLPYADS